mmetsp:Transcript_77471/g.250669  ORF Transcript_77471/g.250669 Transcript_77471/m.250669 type:complete len:453 (-) Transcript_77471:67-1425(-)
MSWRLDVEGKGHASFHRACLRVVHRNRRLILLTACVLGVTQYGMVQVFGAIVNDLDYYYSLTPQEGDVLYSWLNFGACALSFVPGLFCDHLGSASAMAVGTAIGIMPVILQLAWTYDFPQGLSTMQGLIFCYFVFGLSSSFFNVIGSCAPLAAFDEKDAGKVSAAVQVCLSLGITIQSLVYRGLKSAGGDFIETYLIYTLVFLAGCGTLMSLVFAACEDLLSSSSSSSLSSLAERAEASLAMKDVVLSKKFAYMSGLFVLGIGFAFSFLDVEAKLAAEAGLDASALTIPFGVINCFGRIATCVPLDWTRHHRFGGVYTYIFAALLAFLGGMLCVTLPAAPGALHVQVANALVAFGYGGLLGIVPPALRLMFGAENLGLIYGTLYIWVAGSVPAWGLLATKPDGCRGVACYRQYCAGGSAGILAAALLSASMVWATARPKQPPALREGLLAGE